jgi:bifunctional N-acetylglucosamine-1-phosphate-uridyltransferase/glucosamine-1-phosphate-acetyltransferase GlmU-like protein
MKGIIIYGAGATARMAVHVAGDRLCGVVSDSFSENNPQKLGGEWVEHPDALSDYPPSDYVVLVAVGYQHGGMNSRRKEICESLISRGYDAPGNIFLDRVSIHTDVRIGMNCFISSGTVLGHDVVLGSHVWLNANVSIDGGVVIGDRCVIGAGAVIGTGVKLGERTLVGPGAVVLRDTLPGSVWLAPEAKEQRFGSSVFGSIS